MGICLFHIGKLKVVVVFFFLNYTSKCYGYLNNLNNSSVDLLIRAWVKTDDYWDVYYAINERIYWEFPLHGIRFPFPQMDLHIKDGLEGMKQ